MIRRIIENAFKNWQECGGMLFTNRNDELSLASKQSLLALVKAEINHKQRLIVLQKSACSELYKMSDKDNPETLKHFDRLNSIRNGNRSIKKRIKQLARIAKELKLSMQ